MSLFDELNYWQDRNKLIFMFISLILIIISGVAFGIVYFTVGEVQSSLEAVQCDLPGTAFFSDCQDAFSKTVYKIFNLKAILIWASYIFIFTIILVLLLNSYKSGEKPWKIGFLFIGVLGFTYLGILVSNMYRNLLTNVKFYDIMIEMTIYNKVMLNLPWFIGIIGFVSIFLSVVNYQRVQVNQASDLNY